MSMKKRNEHEEHKSSAKPEDCLEKINKFGFLGVQPS